MTKQYVWMEPEMQQLERIRDVLIQVQDVMDDALSLLQRFCLDAFPADLPGGRRGQGTDPPDGGDLTSGFPQVSVHPDVHVQWDL